MKRTNETLEVAIAPLCWGEFTLEVCTIPKACNVKQIIIKKNNKKKPFIVDEVLHKTYNRILSTSYFMTGQLGGTVCLTGGSLARLALQRHSEGQY